MSRAMHRFFRAAAVLLAACGACLAESPGKPGTPTTVRSSSALSVRTQAETENILKLIEAIRLHAERNGGAYPAKIEDLVQKNIISADEFKRLTTSPLDLSGLPTVGYDFYVQGKDINSGENEVLVIGKNPIAPNDARRAVGYQDGRVMWWKRPQLDAFLKTQKKAKAK
jgi:hypothetical protein